MPYRQELPGVCALVHPAGQFLDWAAAHLEVDRLSETDADFLCLLCDRPPGSDRDGLLPATRRQLRTDLELLCDALHAPGCERRTSTQHPGGDVYVIGPVRRGRSGGDGERDALIFEALARLTLTNLLHTVGLLELGEEPGARRARCERHWRQRSRATEPVRQRRPQ